MESSQRRFSVAKQLPENGQDEQDESNIKSEVFGSVISLTEEEDLN